MATIAHNPYDEPEPSSWRLFGNVLLLSLLFHAALITILLLLGIFAPLTATPKKKDATVNLTLIPPPPPKPIFIPTNPQANVPHKVQPVESANDTLLTSKSQVARKPDSIMPDVTGQPHHPNLNDSPAVKPTQQPQISSTPPTPRQIQPEKPTPPTPPAPPQAQPQPQPKPVPQPPKPQPVKPQPQVDPNTGLPVLPAINAPTLAPQNQQAQPLAPASSQLQQAASVHGALGRHGDNSAAAMATELGRYKQYVYSVVGTYWYPDIDSHFGIIPVGMVHIQFTINKDGTLTNVVVLDGNNLVILRDISKRALVAPAPYKPFTDAMIKEVGDSYTDDFTFSVY
jgi:hypothetical protein